MNAKRPTLEVMAPTVEEAIRNGLTDLGLQEGDVDVEILDEGSRGLFGLGSRLARVRLTMKLTEDLEPQPPVRVKRKERLAAVFPIKPAEPVAPPFGQEVKPGDETLSVARQVVEQLLEKMDIASRVTARLGEQDEERNRQTVLVDINGNDLGILIGRKAETLNALQYISSLVLNKRLGRHVTLVLDVQGYRQRRYQILRQLARRMADQALKTGRKQILEPMPANERRIVHMELRDLPGVRTESIGEDPHRKVTIIPVQ